MGIRAGVLLSLLLTSVGAQADELHELYRGTRVAAMGGAYIALADDEQAVWLNPAGLAGNTSSGFHLMIADIGISTDVIGMYGDTASAMSNPSFATFNKLMGKDVAARVQLTPTLVLGSFGVSILGDQQLAFMAENQSLPQIQFGYQTTNGVQAAYGLELFKNRFKNLRLKLGVGAKMLFRRGGYKTLPTAALLNPSPDTLLSRIGNFGQGYGGDFGSLISTQLGQSLKLQGAFVATDIGDTSFGDGPMPVRMNLATGVGLIYSLRNAGRLSLLYELRHINEAADIRKKQHLGLELSLPIVKLYGGYNQAFLTYGAAFDIYLFRLTAASYAEETGTLVFQDPQRRWALRVDVKLGI